jgi:hypothetical protein
VFVIVDHSAICLSLRGNLLLVPADQQHAHSNADSGEGGVKSEMDVERVEVSGAPLGDE